MAHVSIQESKTLSIGPSLDPKIGQTLFYAAFTVYLISRALLATEFAPLLAEVTIHGISILTLGIWLAWILLAIKVLTQNYTLIRLIIVASLLVLSVVSWQTTGVIPDFIFFIIADEIFIIIIN